MTSDSKLFDQVVQISEDYLGPAGERFIRRQITTHLNIDPEQLQKKNIPELIEWLHVAFAVLTRDAHYVNEYVDQVMELAKETSPNRKAEV